MGKVADRLKLDPRKTLEPPKKGPVWEGPDNPLRRRKLICRR